jgi:hypothetical protein
MDKETLTPDELHDLWVLATNEADRFDEVRYHFTALAEKLARMYKAQQEV